jgi:hypothetical protein
MNNNMRWIIIVTGIGILFLLIGTLSYWIIPWPNTDFGNKMISYIGFLLTLVGFTITVYQLRATEIAILESNQKPALQLEVLAPPGRPSESPTLYTGDPTNQVLLYPLEEDLIIGTRIALRIQNIGNKTASHIWLTFLFKRKDMPKKQEIGKLDIYYDLESQGYTSQVTYYDYDQRPDYESYSRQAGLTFKFTENFVIHSDPKDRSVLAEIDIKMKKNDFEPNYEIHYRIQSYEGNGFQEALKDKKTGQYVNQKYPITFKIAGKIT